MSVKDLVFKVKLDPTKFSKGMEQMSKSVDGLSKKRLHQLEAGLKNLGKQSSDVQRKIDLIGVAVTKSDRAKMAKLKLELRELGKHAKKTQAEISGISSAVNKAARSGSRLSRFGAGLGIGVNKLGGAAGSAISNVAPSLGAVGGAAAASMAGGPVIAAIAGLAAVCTLGFTQVSKFAAEGVAGAREAHKIDASLLQELTAQGSADRFSELNDLSGTLQAAMNLDDEAVRQGFTEFLQRGFSVDQLKSNAGLIGDISKSKNISYGEAAEKVAKGLSGDSRVMKELGLAATGNRVTDAAAFSGLAQQKFGGAGAKIAATEGQGMALALKWSDMQQAFGDMILPRLEQLAVKFMDAFTVLDDTGFLESALAALASIIGGCLWITGWAAKLVAYFVGGFGALFESLFGMLMVQGKLIWKALTGGAKALASIIFELLLNALDKIPGFSALISDGAIAKATANRESAFSALGELGETNWGQQMTGAATKPWQNLAAANAVSHADKAKKAQQEIYGAAGFAGAGTYATQHEAMRDAKKDLGSASAQKAAAEAAKYNQNSSMGRLTLRVNDRNSMIDSIAVTGA